MAFERLHRPQRIAGPVDKLAGSDVTEVARRHVGEKRQAHVGGGSTMSDSRYRVLLKVVRRQPMIFGTDKGLEERPRPACGLSQKEYLVTGQPGTAADQGPAYPPGDGRRGGPQQQYGKRNEARSGHGDRDPA